MKVLFKTSMSRTTCACGCGTAIEPGERTVWLSARGAFRFECALEWLRLERKRRHSAASWCMKKVRDAMGVGPLIVGWKGDQPVRLARRGAGPGRPPDAPPALEGDRREAG
jgi:hypothetical protein